MLRGEIFPATCLDERYSKGWRFVVLKPSFRVAGEIFLT